MLPAADASVALDAARWRRWRIGALVSTYVAYAGYYFCRRTFYAVKKPLGDELNFDRLDLAHLGTAYLMAYAVGQFVVAALGQRTGSRALLLVGAMLSIGCGVGFGASSSFWSMAVLMVVNGLAQATGWSACMGIIGNWTTRDERGTVMGFWSTCYQLGGILVTSWVALWLALSNWRGAYYASAAVLFLGWIVVHLFARDRPSDVELDNLPEEPPAGAPGRPGGWTRGVVITVVLIGLCYFGIKFVRYAVWSWGSYVLDDFYGASRELSSTLSGLFDLGGFLGVVVAGLLSDKLFRGRRARLSFFLLLGMAAACGVLYAGGGGGLTLFLVSMFAIGFTLYGPDALLSGAAAIEVGSPRIAIAAAGVINGMGSVGSIIQEYAFVSAYGGAKDMSAVLAILFVASLGALASLGAVLWRNRRGLSDL